MVEQNNEATRVVERLRAVNEHLRTGRPLPPDIAAELAAAQRGEEVTPPPPPPPSLEGQPAVRSGPMRREDYAPLSDDDRLEAWARERGVRLDHQGKVVEHVPVRNTASEEVVRQEEEVPLFPKKAPSGSPAGFSRLQGVNLEKGCVVVDGSEYPISPAERAEVAKFVIQVVARELGKALNALAAANGIQEEQPSAPANVPEVPGDEANEPVLPKTKSARRREARVQRVRRHENQSTPAVDDEGKGPDVPA